MTDKLPYLSLVLTGRNDNYGGDFRMRLQRCIANTHRLLTQHQIPSEIIFVNYNPVVDNPPIEQFIDWPEGNQIVNVRIITIPKAVHQELVAVNPRKDIPVMEYLGKNAGIRRAKGTFILSMNPDIILPDALMPQLQQLNPNSYHRVDRVDFSGDLDAEHRFERIFLKGQDYELNELSEIPKLRKKNDRLNRWRAITPKLEAVLNFVSSPVYYNRAEYTFHCNVSGDFMLMHRDSWFKLNGHHEHRPIALHVDALTVVQTAMLGLNEVVFDEVIFHQAHESRYTASRENPEQDEAFRYFLEESSEMMKNKKPNIYNGSDWGCVKFDLPEINL